MSPSVASSSIPLHLRSTLERVGLDRTSSLLVSLKVAFAVSFLLSLGLVALELMGLSPIAALRDAGSTDQAESGLVSNLGILLMGAAGLIALIGGWRLNHIALGVLGAFCGVFALDDGLLIHERLGDWEVLAYGFYAGLMLSIFYLYLKTKAVLPMALLVCLGAFGASVILDLFWSPVIGAIPLLQDHSWLMTQLGYIFEDVPKFTGIFMMFSFALGECALEGR